MEVHLGTRHFFQQSQRWFQRLLRFQLTTKLIKETGYFFFSCFLAAALKCFTCKGTDKSCGKRKLEGNKTFYLQTCLAGFDRCMRTWTKDKDGVTEVFSSCAKQSLCEQAKERCEDNDQKCAVGCCSNDACNASSTIVISIILFITCFGTGLTLLT